METKLLALFFVLILTPHLSKCDTSTLTPQNINTSQKRDRDIQKQFLQTHNTIRAKLRLPPLRWSKKLAAYATSWAETRRSDCDLIHSGGDYGENLFWGSGGGWGPRDAVLGWASESKFYDRRANRCRPDRDCLHYTQLVWKKSRRVGCAIVVCNSGDTFVTCNYDPPGNFVGQKPF